MGRVLHTTLLLRLGSIRRYAAVCCCSSLSSKPRFRTLFFININIFYPRTPLRDAPVSSVTTFAACFIVYCTGFIYFIVYVKLADLLQAFFAYDYNSGFLYFFFFITSRDVNLMEFWAVRKSLTSNTWIVRGHVARGFGSPSTFLNFFLA